MVPQSSSLQILVVRTDPSDLIFVPGSRVADFQIALGELWENFSEVYVDGEKSLTPIRNFVLIHTVNNEREIMLVRETPHFDYIRPSKRKNPRCKDKP